ncbi:prominin-2 [Pholidichthys leucotaenia]
MRGRRWQGSVGIGLMLLGLSLAQSAPPHTCPATAAASPQNFTQPNYLDVAKKDPSVVFMSPLVQSFLNTVQPNDFPKDLILKLIRDLSKVPDNIPIKEILIYEVGFLVCIAIGIIYIILMPIVGFFLACCRCCGNCGGKMYQKQTSSIHSWRRALYWSAFITTIIILAGNICMFRSNEALKGKVDQSPVDLRNTIGNIHTFITAIPQQVDFVVHENYRAVEKVIGNLNDIGPQLGTEIQTRFSGNLDPALLSVKRLDREINEISFQLKTLNSSLAQLQSNMESVQNRVTGVENRINQTLSKPACFQCEKQRPELEKLTLDTSISSPGLNELQSAVDEVTRANLSSQIDNAEAFVDIIPETVTSETKEIVQRSTAQLNVIKDQLSLATNISSFLAVANISGILNDIQSEIDKFIATFETAERIRWAVCVAVCCVVLLVVVCNFLGLVLGPLGLAPEKDPTKRSGTSDCGGTFLMMSAGFSFLFSWLFMIAVVILFVLGGNVYTLVCRPWNSGALLKFIDTPGLIPGFEIGPALGLEANLSISSIYRDCSKNQPLWTTLHLNELVDLDDLFDISTYKQEIEQEFNNVDISFPPITLLSSEVKNKLSNISNKTNSFDATEIHQQMKKVSIINLNKTADLLNELAENQTNTAIETELRAEATELTIIQADIEMTIFPQLEKLNSSIKSLQSTSEKIVGTVGEVLSNVGAAQDFLTANTTQIVKALSRRFLDCQLGYFTTYADWAKLMIRKEVGRCGPFALAVDSAEVIVCAHMVGSLNAFWFSLGWCLIFFIPSIIFTIKLAKYYRRMKYSDVTDNHIAMNQIPRAQMKLY